MYNWLMLPCVRWLFRQLHEWYQVGCSALNIALVDYLLPFPSYGLSLHKPGIYACSSRAQVIMQTSSSSHWVMWLSCKLQLLSSEISGVRPWTDEFAISILILFGYKTGWNNVYCIGTNRTGGSKICGCPFTWELCSISKQVPVFHLSFETPEC
jgi:hypothetical protein